MNGRLPVYAITLIPICAGLVGLLGGVTVAKPRCDKCGSEVDLQKVVWG
jgi:hypothetical protein